MIIKRVSDTCVNRYNKTIHDLYEYPSDPVFGGAAEPWTGADAGPSGYNKKSYLYSAPYTMDLSGTTIRPKRYGASYSNLFTGSCASSPYGDTTDELEYIQDIANWNSGVPKSVLINPNIIIGCRHFYAILVSQTASFKILFKNNISANVSATCIARDNVTDSPLLNGSDLIIFKITTVSYFRDGTTVNRTDLSQEYDEGLVECYRHYIPNEYATTGSTILGTDKFNTPIGFRIDGNDRLHRGFLQGYPNGLGIVPDASPSKSLTYTDIDVYQPEVSIGTDGDSGSPTFVYDKTLNKTVFIGLQYAFNFNAHILTQNLAYINSVIQSSTYQSGAKYPLIPIDVSTLDLMTLSDWSGLYVNNNNTLLNLPENLGKIRVKDEKGILQSISQLYKNDGDGSASIIWDITPPPEPTDVPTDIPTDIPTDVPTDGGGGGEDGGGGICGVCAAGTPVYYPIIPFSGRSHTCEVWKQTCNIFDLQLDELRTNQLIDTPDASQKYGKVYNFITTPTPPPPGFIVADYSTFTIKDRVAVYINNKFQKTAFRFNGLTDQDPNILFPVTQSKDFNNLHGVGNDTTIYSYSCDISGSNGVAAICNTVQYPVEGKICACYGTCVEGAGYVRPEVTGDNTPCQQLSDIAAYTPLLIDTGCRGTSVDGCDTSCYGTPAITFSTDPVEILNYSCRTVSPVPTNIISYAGVGVDSIESSGLESLGIDLYDSGYSFGDFSIINESGCSYPEDCPDDPEAPCSSAWRMRIFLPFYVNVPSIRYGSNGLAGSTNTNFSLMGRYIKFTKQDLDLTSSGTNQYSNIPLLQTAVDLVTNKIKSSGISFTFPYDFAEGSVSSSYVYWLAREIPKQISSNVPSHTHQVVVEITGSTSKCTVCYNGNGSVGGTSYDISNIGLYPITDTLGAISPNIINFLNETLDGDGSGIQDVQGIRYFRHGTSVGALYKNNTTVFNQNNLASLNDVCGDFINQTTGQFVVNTFGTPQETSGITLLKTLNILQQPTVATDVSVNCVCTQV